MIPIRDSIPNIHRPWGVYLLMAVNALVFIFQMGLPPRAHVLFLNAFGVVPARFLAGHDGLLDHYLPFLTYMFLHGGWLHFLMNMWILYIFADNVEDVMGSRRFLTFYVLCGLAAVAGHVAFNAGSRVPVVGASGAIAGVMGAYLLLYPQGTVVTYIPIFFLPYITELPSALFLTIWFLVQLFSGLVAFGSGAQGGVAFMAHAAGFVAGIALLPLFRKPERCYYCFNRAQKRYELKDGQ